MSKQGKEIFNTERAERLISILGNAVLVKGTTSGTPNAETTHAHKLEEKDVAVIPRGFIVISQDKAGTVYDGTGHTTALLKVKSDIASVTFTALVF